jgi:hypothetical protein
LVRGYRNSSEEGKRQRERADQLERDNAALLEALTRGQPTPRQDVPSRPTRPEDRLLELGVDPAAIEEIFDQRAAALVDERVRQAFEPITRGLEARQTMVSRHPDYLRYEQAVAEFVARDPELSQTYAAAFARDPVTAMERALLKYSQHRWAQFQQAPVPGRADAAIPTSRAGEGRRAPTGDVVLQDAFERFQKTGSSRDAQAYARARLKGVISDEFLNQ